MSEELTNTAADDAVTDPADENTEAPETSGRGYVVPSTVSKAYTDVFHIFGAAAGTCIADRLALADSEDQTKTPLVIVTGAELLIYPESGSDATVIAYHDGTDQGFNELTAISHVGPAMGYFAEMKSMGKNINDEPNKATVVALRTAMKEVQDENTAFASDYWMNKLESSANPYYSIKAPQMKKMVDHACQHTIDYIDQYLAGTEGYDFSYDSLHKYYFNDREGVVGYNQIMVATFSLVIVDGTTFLKNQMDSLKDVDFNQAVWMFNGQAGGIGSGMNDGTSSTYAQIRAILGKDFGENSMFTPYASPSADAVTGATYADDAARATAYKNLGVSYRSQYFNLIARNTVALKMFDDSVPMLAQAYPTWSDGPATLETLIARMKTCMVDDRQLMSNCVADACGNLLIEAGWDLEKLVLPCFDANW